MKKIILLLFGIIISGTIYAQQNIIDMEAFQSYMAELQDAEDNNDKNKIAELQKKYPQYDRKKLKKEAKNNPVACAYIAGYYENDYRKNKKSKDLIEAANYYQIALYNRRDNPKYAQVAWTYACFLLKYREHHSELRRTKYSQTIVNKDYDRATDRDYTLTYNQFKDRVYWEIFSYIDASANKGYRPAQYARIRIYRCLDFPYEYNRKKYVTSGDDILWQLSYSDEVKQRIHNAKETRTRIDRVVGYYKELAYNGTPEIQNEFAYYLLQTRLFSWSSEAFELYGKPFSYKSSGILDDYFDVVRDEFSDDDIEEMISYWYLQAAKQGDICGMMNTAYCMYYQLAPYNDSLHVNEIINWLEQTAARGEIGAYYALSLIMMNERFSKNKSYKLFENHQKAFEYAQKGAKMGDVNCQNILARYYFLGIGTKEDKIEALKWAQKAAEYSELQSANCLSGLLYSDKSVGNDMGKAVYYFKRSTTLKESLEWLALCYSKGLGVAIDKKEAMEYEERASDKMKGAWGGWNESYYNFIPNLILYQ